MDSQDDFAEKDGIVIIQFFTFVQCCFKSGEGDTFRSHEQSFTAFPNLQNLDGIFHLGILKFLEIPAQFGWRLQNDLDGDIGIEFFVLTLED